MPNTRDALRAVSDPTFDSVKLFHKSSPHWPVSQDDPPRPMHICVFDSSYNPPTRAHLAIASSSFPPAPTETTADENGDIRLGLGKEAYTARLLLLSARNVDKTLKEGDATLAQRLEMITLQAKEMSSDGSDTGGVSASNARRAGPAGKADPSMRNTAVAALNHPTFVGKSEIILRWLRDVHLPSIPSYDPSRPRPIRLTFLIGTDTLVRIWVPKYYTSDPKLGQDMNAHLERFFIQDQSRIVSAHRGSSEEDARAEQEFIDGSGECQAALTKGWIRFMKQGDLGPAEMAMSSTALRKAVQEAEKGERRERFGEMDKLCVPMVRDYIWDKRLYR